MYKMIFTSVNWWVLIGKKYSLIFFILYKYVVLETEHVKLNELAWIYLVN